MILIFKVWRAMLKRIKERLFCFILSLASLNTLAEPRAVTFGTILYPPGTNIEENTGKCIGSNIDRTRKILRHYDININVVCTAPIRIYKMIENNQIDFTINIKSTLALSPYVEFTRVPSRQIILNLYKHKNVDVMTSISAVRGFDYNGHRLKFTEQEIEFIDLHNTISAIQVFVRQRSDALLSYQGPMDYYLATKGIDLDDTVQIKKLLTLDSFYAINKESPYAEILHSALDDFAEKNELKYYVDFNEF